MTRDGKVRALRAALGREQLVKGDEHVFWCPRPDCMRLQQQVGAKLSVNVVSDYFHCWICDRKGRNLVPLLRLGPDRSIVDDYLSTLSSHREPPKKQHVSPRLPDEFRPLTEPSRSPHVARAMEYLAGRGVTSDDIRRYKLGFCEDGPFRDRIVFPSFDETGELNFVVGRSINRVPNNARYRHDELDKDIVFNDYLVDWSQPVVLVEGPFDMVSAGENAIPLQGTNLNVRTRLFRKIVSRGVPVYFALDSDVLGKQLRMVKTFLEYDVSSYHVDLGQWKDVSAMGRERFTEARAVARRMDDELDLLRVRVMNVRGDRLAHSSHL